MNKYYYDTIWKKQGSGTVAIVFTVVMGLITAVIGYKMFESLN